MDTIVGFGLVGMAAPNDNIFFSEIVNESLRA
jgi:hypothetical protein